MLVFLQGLQSARAAMVAALGANPNRSCAYYLCPLSTLRIIAQQGILPRVSAPAARADVSGADVQSRREGSVGLQGWRERKLHECINLFWNPLNLTCRAFQRRALLVEQGSGNPDDGVICILEIELDPLVRDGTCYWTIAPGNFAQFPFASFSPKKYAGTERNKSGELYYDWPGIYSVDQSSQAQWANSKRSAEFIVWMASGLLPKASAPIPFQHVGRVLVPDNSVRALTAEQLAWFDGMGRPYSRLSITGAVRVFYPPVELLDSERRFLRNLQSRADVDPGVFDKLNATIATLRDFEARHPQLAPTHDKFKHDGAAHGHHGSAHACRVMFWAAFLAQHLPEAERVRVLDTVLAAAAIHDTRRSSNAGDDQVHGGKAAAAFDARVKAAIPDAGLAAACLAAVTAHCQPDEGCAQKDVIWRLLKDADALDRGRFGQPNEKGGCTTATLRDELLRVDAKNNVAWMAYNVSKMTAHLNTEGTPCANLGTAVHDGLYAYARVVA